MPTANIVLSTERSGNPHDEAIDERHALEGDAPQPAISDRRAGTTGTADLVPHKGTDKTRTETELRSKNQLRTLEKIRRVGTGVLTLIQASKAEAAATSGEELRLKIAQTPDKGGTKLRVTGHEALMPERARTSPTTGQEKNDLPKVRPEAGGGATRAEAAKSPSDDRVWYRLIPKTRDEETGTDWAEGANKDQLNLAGINRETPPGTEIDYRVRPAVDPKAPPQERIRQEELLKLGVRERAARAVDAPSQGDAAPLVAHSAKLDTMASGSMVQRSVVVGAPRESIDEVQKAVRAHMPQTLVQWEVETDPQTGRPVPYTSAEAAHAGTPTTDKTYDLIPVNQLSAEVSYPDAPVPGIPHCKSSEFDTNYQPRPGERTLDGVFEKLDGDGNPTGGAHEVPISAMNRHIMITGKTGAGKSRLVARIAGEWVATQSKLAQTDPNAKPPQVHLYDNVKSELGELISRVARSKGASDEHASIYQDRIGVDKIRAKIDMFTTAGQKVARAVSDGIHAIAMSIEGGPDVSRMMERYGSDGAEEAMERVGIHRAGQLYVHYQY
jgi:hypothetical protein